MHHPWRYATVVAVALALTACSDSARSPITGPDGVLLAKGTVTPLSDAQTHLLSQIVEQIGIVYACAPETLLSNKLKEPVKLKKYAEFGWYFTTEGKPHETVEFIVNKLNADALADIADGKIPASCDGAYDSATDAATDLATLLNTFLNEHESLSDSETTVVVCPDDTGCLEPGIVDIPALTFGQLVTLIRSKNPNAYPDQEFLTVGDSWIFEIHPVTALARNVWTRCIEWGGYNPGVDDLLPDPSTVVMIRLDENGDPEFLPTTAGACTPPPPNPNNAFIRGAYKLFAGFPFLPKELHAYVPTKPFGGSGTAASPHFLTILDQSNPFDALCLLTESYSPPTANAGCTKLFKARDCDVVGDESCVNTELNSYIQVVSTGLNNGKLTDDQAIELTNAANALKYPE